METALKYKSQAENRPAFVQTDLMTFKAIKT
jgi:hypothetical protein